MVLSRAELKTRLGDLAQRFDELCRAVDHRALVERQSALELQMAQAGFWEDQERARRVIAELSDVKRTNDDIQALARSLADARELAAIAIEEDDDGLLGEMEPELAKARGALEELEIAMILGGPYDKESAFLSVHAGAGGTDAADWAQMLGRMYARWAEDQGYQAAVVDTVPGEEAGVRQMTLSIKGVRAYGYLKAEIGVHRLVRISPFDAKKRRHTSFAAVDVIPDASEEINVEIRDSDLRIDTFRAGGAGGQHVNVTDSAVRITHAPTGIVVQCQNERSQHSNRATAMKMLKARLIGIEEKKREDTLKHAYDEKGEIAWGNQIRSYVLQPYTLVKDHRTDLEVGNVQAVLDGALAPFINTYLRARLLEGRK
ncbi:MAG TPA: peptide chain release factor 2 [Planctomycetes bacterium]|nr:peptide chain release factor 2 [Planctomycetota bacterium]